MSSVNIAIDISSLSGDFSGIPRYITELVKALGGLHAPEKFYALARCRKAEVSDISNMETIAADLPFWLTLFVPYTLLRKHCSLVHFPYPTLPPWLPCPSIITLHDLAFIRNPDWFTDDMLDNLKNSWLPAIQRANHILCDSEFTAHEAIELLGVKADKITVAYLGSFYKGQRENETKAAHPNDNHPYVLAVGTIQPRKNYRRLIEAFAAASKQLSGIDLCIVGSQGWKADEIPDLIQQSHTGDRVKLIGHVTDEALVQWYRNATAFAMVSQYEGFGLPLLEAFTLGIPSIASNNSSLAEVARDAALLVDPMDRDSIAAGLVAICKTTDLRKTLEAKGLARAQEFSWERCARETLAAYRKLS